MMARDHEYLHQYYNLTHTLSDSNNIDLSSCMSGERRRRTRRDRRVQELRQAVQATLEQAVLLELLPDSELEVFVQVLQADGGERTACINAAVLAVANAGKSTVL